MKRLIRSGSFKDINEEVIIIYSTKDPDLKILDKDEISYQGKMYDIISSGKNGTTAFFRCINDTKEEQLVAHYNKFSTSISGMTSPEKSKTSQAMLYHIIKHALVNKYSIPQPTDFSLIMFSEPDTKVNSITILPSYPPPRFV